MTNVVYSDSAAAGAHSEAASMQESSVEGRDTALDKSEETMRLLSGRAGGELSATLLVAAGARTRNTTSPDC